MCEKLQSTFLHVTLLSRFLNLKNSEKAYTSKLQTNTYLYWTLELCKSMISKSATSTSQSSHFHSHGVLLQSSHKLIQCRLKLCFIISDPQMSQVSSWKVKDFTKTFPYSPGNKLWMSWIEATIPDTYSWLPSLPSSSHLVLFYLPKIPLSHFPYLNPRNCSHSFSPPANSFTALPVATYGWYQGRSLILSCCLQSINGPYILHMRSR